MLGDPATLLSDAARSRLIDRFGAGVSSWCDELPELVRLISRAWNLRIEHALSAGSTSVVLACRDHDDEPLVLKLTPEPAIAKTEAAALDTWLDSPHVVGLLDADTASGALLLETLHPGTPLRESPRGWSLPELAPLLADLWRSRPLGNDHGLPELSERIELIFGLTEHRRQRWTDVAERIPYELLDASRTAALALTGDGPVGLLHGDLHPGNVLAGGRGPVAIDPRPCLGDRNFDAVDWVLAGVTTRRELEDNIDELAGLVPLSDPMRTRAWCQAIAVVNAVIALRRNSSDPHAYFLVQLAAGTA